MTKSQRISVSGRNLQYLQDLAKQMDEPNLGAVMTYLLTDIRGLGYKFGDKNYSDKPQPEPQQPQAPIGYTHFDTSTFEKVAPIPEVERNYIDPVIARMSQLIEDF